MNEIAVKINWNDRFLAVTQIITGLLFMAWSAFWIFGIATVYGFGLFYMG